MYGANGANGALVRLSSSLLHKLYKRVLFEAIFLVKKSNNNKYIKRWR